MSERKEVYTKHSPKVVSNGVSQKKQRGGKPTPKYLIIRDAIHSIMTFNDRDECIEYIMDKYDLGERVAKEYADCAQASMDYRMQRYQVDIVERNTKRITAIYEECYEKGKYKEALSALDMLNKMSGIYETKVTLQADEPVRISFEK